MYSNWIDGILDDALEKLSDYTWSGNVRQFEHAIVRYPGLAALPSRFFYPQVENYERALLADALRDTNRRPTRAARLLGLNSKNFNRLLKARGLDEL